MKRKISVFIASPGDLANERRRFKKEIELLNLGFGDGANVEFVPFGWEDTPASTGRRSQGVINQEIDNCDVFILAMHRRWGQDAPDAAPYTSYTEEEFHRAIERWKKEGSPEIFVFFKRVDAPSLADPGPHLTKVMNFRKQLEDTRQVLYRYFEDEDGFANEVDRHLRAYAKGELPKTPTDRDTVVLPLAALEEVEKAKALAEQKAQEAELANDNAEKTRLKLEMTQMQIAEDAAALSKEGKIEYARQKFSELVVETTDIRILFLGYEFFERTGDLDSAFEALKRWLNISGPENKSAETAGAYGNLGNLYRIRGDLDRAEEMHQKALAINESLGRKGDMADDYNYLGLLYQTLGDLDRAEEMHQKALAINESLGHKGGMANNYGNLGNLYRVLGDLDRAEEMYHKVMAIDEAIGRTVSMANAYGNLGLLYNDRGDLDRAEEMYQKALAIDETIGRKVGMASHYGNLGLLYYDRGDLDRAEKMHQKALAINESLGHKVGMANQFGNLGNLYRIRGDLDRAEKMYMKSLAISEALGHKEGMANNYNNLGILYKTRGDLKSAEEMFQKALHCYDSLKSPQAIKVREMLKELRPVKGKRK